MAKVELSTMASGGPRAATPSATAKAGEKRSDRQPALRSVPVPGLFSGALGCAGRQGPRQLGERPRGGQQPAERRLDFGRRDRLVERVGTAGDQPEPAQA